MTGHVLISSVKDEGPFLLEWVAHHRVLGFDRICIASNDCRDGTDRLLQAMDQAGHIHHVPNPLSPGEIPQHAGYARIRAAGLTDGAAWLMVLDADEFLNVHAKGHRVGDLTGLAAPDIDVIALNGLCFTDEPEVNWQPGPVCPRFTCHVGTANKANTALKCLTRNPARFRAIHNHHMVGFRSKSALQVMSGDGSRWQVPPEQPIFKALRFSPLRKIRHDLAQYNHYSVKTWDSFMLRRARGRGAVAGQGAENLRHTEDYFAARNLGVGTDISILRYQPQVQAMMAEMLQSAALRRAQQEAEQLYAAFAAPYRR